MARTVQKGCYMSNHSPTIRPSQRYVTTITPTTPQMTPAELASLRTTQAESIRILRFRAVIAAMDALGVSAYHDSAPTSIHTLHHMRDTVQHLRASLRDGSDEARYVATGTALRALAALWEVS